MILAMAVGGDSEALASARGIPAEQVEARSMPTGEHLAAYVGG